LRGRDGENHGPREALEHVRAIIYDALRTNDLVTVREHLNQMRAITEKAIGRDTLHAARTLSASILQQCGQVR
jgi:hypothetical protein